MESLCRPVLQPFLDTSTPYEDARYVIIGAPLDSTASYRSGSRFAPDAIRLTSQYMETHSARTGLDLKDVSLADAGNIKDLVEVEDALGRIKEVVGVANRDEKLPVLLGGEHTATLGALRALDPDLVVDFDAHLDLRDRLMGQELSHATFMRRAMEELDFRLVVIGCRAVSEEELDYVGGYTDRITVVTAADIIKKGVDTGIEAVLGCLDSASSAYLSFDMDVVDPASAPAVGNPSPEGLSVTQVLDMIHGVSMGRFLGFDLMEVTPHYDSGLTSTQAAHIVLEAIYFFESRARVPRGW